MPAVTTFPELVVALPRPSSIFTRPIPGPSLWLAIGIILLNLVDACGTLWHVSRGAEELNPVMARLLDQGPLAFFIGKHLLACGGVIGILAHGPTPAARWALAYLLLPVYGAIAAYQVLLVLVT
ncbi:MAG: hypothetical protein HY698_18135 [Deltaproteobacteria bacterium]|nr:hypothetical protein [Deltaproteobacteria bacterium]